MRIFPVITIFKSLFKLFLFSSIKIQAQKNSRDSEGLDVKTGWITDEDYWKTKKSLSSLY